MGDESGGVEFYKVTRKGRRALKAGKLEGPGALLMELTLRMPGSPRAEIDKVAGDLLDRYGLDGKDALVAVRSGAVTFHLMAQGTETIQ